MSKTITLPQQQDARDCLAYEEWFIKQVQAGMADEINGRVFGKDEFWTQLEKVRCEPA